MEITDNVRRRTSRESAGEEADGSSFGSCNEENPRKSSLHMLFPMTSINHNSSGGVSPETKFTNFGSVSPNTDCTSEEPHIPKWPNTPLTLKENALVTEGVSMTKLMKRESYKAQRKTYRQEKKRVANELLNMLQDPSIIVLADWLKIRGTLKGWTKLWCVLKPGLFLLYKSPNTNKSSHWVGTILLGSCELIERPSKKNGFCFKLFHPLEQSIWATRGPCGETMGAMVQPLPNAYLIFRASSEPAGKCWMDALELALRCSSLLIRSMSRDGSRSTASNPQSPLLSPPVTGTPPCGDLMVPTSSPLLGKVNMWTDMDYEHHFRDHDLEDDALTDNDQRDADGVESLVSSDSESEGQSEPQCENDHPPIETPYTESGCEEFGLVGDAGQTEEVAEENKSLIWTLVKQVRPGMDLSKVVLPTFILEPRSFLDKLSDYHYHADIVSKAVLEDDPFTRMKLITQWYLSGFYKKPRGLKKPYNPILGEIFRCYWQHTDTNTRTFYFAEQVSHHPPVSAFYITNRKDGFCISGSILARSKFYGNSLSAILDGQACLSLLTRGEDYILTMPYAHCKGILLGTMSLELGGKVSIDCEKTGYHTELEFKLKPFLGRVEYTNMISGKMKLGKETLATIEGHWDDVIQIIDRRTEESSVFWNPTLETRARRLKRFTVPMDHQRDYESERLWHRVTLAIMKCDQVAATEEKTILEEAQRQDVKQRKVMRQEWVPRFFHQDINGGWVYNHSDSRPWDPRNDVIQFERDCVIRTKTRHLTPVVRISSSLMSVDDKVESHTFQRVKQRQKKKGSSQTSSTERNELLGSDCSDSDGSSKANQLTKNVLDTALQPLVTSVRDNAVSIASLQRHMTTVIERQRADARRDWILIVLLALMHGFLYWVLNQLSK